MSVEIIFRCQVKKSTKRRKDNDGLPEVYCIVSPYGLFGLYAQVRRSRIIDEIHFWFLARRDG